MSGAVNGVGPAWMPAFIRRWATDFSKHFFDEASWGRHDIGYGMGYPSRAGCDRKFLCAMLRDASKKTRTMTVLACVALALTYWLLCRAFGWMSYNKRGR